MGTSKALLPFGDETMLERVVRLLGTVVSPLVVVAAPGQKLPALPESVIVARDEREGQGPLEGLRAGLRALSPGDDGVDLAYVTGCDAPLLVPAFVERMLACLGDSQAAVMEVDGFLHPLSAVYRRSVLPRIDVLIAAGERRLASLFDEVSTRRVFPEEMASADPGLRTLRNLNTPQDYQDALAAAEK